MRVIRIEVCPHTPKIRVIFSGCNMRCEHCSDSEICADDAILYPATTPGKVAEAIIKLARDNNFESLIVDLLGGDPLLQYEDIVPLLDQLVFSPNRFSKNTVIIHTSGSINFERLCDQLSSSIYFNDSNNNLLFNFIIKGPSQGEYAKEICCEVSGQPKCITYRNLIIDPRWSSGVYPMLTFEINNDEDYDYISQLREQYPDLDSKFTIMLSGYYYRDMFM